MEKLLTAAEVMEVFQIGYSSLLRWRKSGAFPEPLIGGGKKLLWSEDQIQDWLHRRSTPLASPPTSPSPSKQQKRDKKSFEQRQKAAQAALQKHGAGR